MQVITSWVCHCLWNRDRGLTDAAVESAQSKFLLWMVWKCCGARWSRRTNQDLFMNLVSPSYCHWLVMFVQAYSGYTLLVETTCLNAPGYNVCSRIWFICPYFRIRVIMDIWPLQTGFLTVDYSQNYYCKFSIMLKVVGSFWLSG